MSNETLDYLRGQFDTQQRYLDKRFDKVDKCLDDLKKDQEKKDAAQDKRITALEHRKVLNTAAATLGGIIGGVASALGLDKFKI